MNESHERERFEAWACAEQIVRQLEVDDPMGPDGRRYTVQWIAAIIAEAKDSEREAQPLPKTCPACGTDLLCEHGIPFKDKCGRCEEATGAPSIEPLPAVPLRKLLGKVVRLTDGITKKEKVHSPLWFLGCEIYDEICAAYDVEELRAESGSPAVPYSLRALLPEPPQGEDSCLEVVTKGELEDIN